MLRQSPLCRRECATGKGPDSGNQALASTEDLLSTSGWRQLLTDFTTGPQTRLIAIKVMSPLAVRTAFDKRGVGA